MRSRFCFEGFDEGVKHANRVPNGRNGFWCRRLISTVNVKLSCRNRFLQMAPNDGVLVSSLPDLR